jgi:hypothetical protein
MDLTSFAWVLAFVGFVCLVYGLCRLVIPPR